MATSPNGRRSIHESLDRLGWRVLWLAATFSFRAWVSAAIVCDSPAGEEPSERRSRTVLQACEPERLAGAHAEQETSV